METGGHNADHGVVVVAELDLTANDRRIPVKLLPPELVAQNDDFRTVEGVVRCPEIATHRWSDSQHAEEAGAHALSFEACRLRICGQSWLPRLKDRH